MSLIAEKDVRKIAKLARIGVSDEDVASYSKELSQILGLFEQLEEVNTDGVPTMVSVEDMELKMREDEPIIENTVEEVLSNAPSAKFNCFEVPKVVE
ncbi:MAG: Asp-tRNA(Asn)/Glu-tRNA(Gln) amidotransferase subunit GatC [Alphaproteobacteria bacterium]